MSHSSQLFQEANHVLVGGVNSPVRAFKAVGRDPLFFKSGEGAYLNSVDDIAYIDYVLSWGPLILGHANPTVVEAITNASKLGTSFGAPSENETKLAQKILNFYPYADKVRFVNSGTEAVMSALRVARGVTNRDLIVKFKGCYHGHVDSLLVAAGSGGLTLGQPDSAGVSKNVASETIILDYNDTESVKSIFKEKGHQIAGVILEPVTGNMGVMKASQDFISQLKKECDSYLYW